MTSTATRPATTSAGGTRGKTVLTQNTGHVEFDVPRDRAGTHLPPIAVKRQRRLTGVDEVVLSFVCERADHRGDLSTLRGDLRRDGERGDDLADHRQGDARRCSRGRPGHWTACTQRSSSMRWW